MKLVEYKEQKIKLKYLIEESKKRIHEINLNIKKEKREVTKMECLEYENFHNLMFLENMTNYTNYTKYSNLEIVKRSLDNLKII